MRISDWSSDVCYSDLEAGAVEADRRPAAARLRPHPRGRGDDGRRISAEPGLGLSDAHHAARHGPDRGSGGGRGAPGPFDHAGWRSGMGGEGRGGGGGAGVARVTHARSGTDWMSVVKGEGVLLSLDPGGWHFL